MATVKEMIEAMKAEIVWLDEGYDVDRVVTDWAQHVASNPAEATQEVWAAIERALNRVNGQVAPS